MKKHGVLNHDLARVIATLGHTDALVIADAGLPVPPNVERIDLAVTENVPRFIEVLRAVMQEMQVERVVLARELGEKSPELYVRLKTLLGELPTHEVSHEEFKALTTRARAVVRTGEFTPYANILLYSGVVF